MDVNGYKVFGRMWGKKRAILDPNFEPWVGALLSNDDGEKFKIMTVELTDAGYELILNPVAK
ncbi:MULTISPECIES: hypothetical protein [unclassified Aliiroseovarius]|uniref:hypothetical protein n=1 Tax=unclassified Aliiroseovarius TaxID=2623558 RepID=UPI0015683A5D|nr:MULTISPECIES: hypothetical protein [unclassified Aliiroseovarius]